MLRACIGGDPMFRADVVSFGKPEIGEADCLRGQSLRMCALTIGMPMRDFIVRLYRRNPKSISVLSTGPDACCIEASDGRYDRLVVRNGGRFEISDDGIHALPGSNVLDPRSGIECFCGINAVLQIDAASPTIPGPDEVLAMQAIYILEVPGNHMEMPLAVACDISGGNLYCTMA
jgi:hypothetical protein